jgi:hypothetical protein
MVGSAGTIWLRSTVQARPGDIAEGDAGTVLLRDSFCLTYIMAPVYVNGISSNPAATVHFPNGRFFNLNVLFTMVPVHLFCVRFRYSGRQVFTWYCVLLGHFFIILRHCGILIQMYLQPRFTIYQHR